MSDTELLINLIYQSELLTFPKVVKLINTLKAVNVYDFKVKIASADSEFIGGIRTSIQSSQSQREQTQALMANKNFQLYHKYEPNPNKQFKKIVQMDNIYVAKIFLHQYHQKIAAMKQEEDLDIVLKGPRIIIFSHNPLTKLMQCEIISMKQRLQTFSFASRQLFEKVQYSQSIVKKLESKHIMSTFTLKNRLIFHSICLKPQELFLELKKYDYDLPILKFKSQCMFDCDNKVFFLLLLSRIKSRMEYIEENYEVKIEVNTKKRAFVLHSLHSIFSQEPMKQIRALMGKFLYISYRSSDPIQHLYNIEKNKPHNPKALKSTARNGRIFICWDKSKNILPQEVGRVFRKFLSSVYKNTELKVYFLGSDFCKDHRQKYLELVHKHHLECSNYSQILERESDVMVVRFKSFMLGKNKQKKIQFSLFLQDLICERTEDISSEEDKHLKEDTFMVPSQQVQLVPTAPEIVQERILKDQQRIKWSQGLQCQYQSFLQVFPGQEPQNRKFRSKNMEAVLNNKCIRARVWYYFSSLASQDLDHISSDKYSFCVVQEKPDFEDFDANKAKSIQNIEESGDYLLIGFMPSLQKWIPFFEMTVYKNC